MTPQPAPAEQATLPPLPKPAHWALIEGVAMQGSEIRPLAASYEPGCAQYTASQMQEYAQAALLHAQRVAPISDERKMLIELVACKDRRRAAAALMHPNDDGEYERACEALDAAWELARAMTIPATGMADTPPGVSLLDGECLSRQVLPNPSGDPSGGAR